MMTSVTTKLFQQRCCVTALLLILAILISCGRQNDYNSLNIKEILESADSVRFVDPAAADSMFRLVLYSGTSKTGADYLRACIGLSKVKTDQGVFDSAKIMLDNISEYVINAEDSIISLDYHLARGYLFTKTDNVVQAEQAYNTGLQLAESRSNEEYQHIFRINLGQSGIESGNYAQALKTLMEELDFAEARGEKSHMATALQNIAEVRYLTGEFHHALTAARRALGLFSGLNMITESGRIMMNMGVYYRNLGNYDSALVMYRKAGEQVSQQGDSTGMIKIRYNMANILALQMKYPEAEIEMKFVFEYCTRKGIQAGQIFALSGLAMIYEESGNLSGSITVIDSAIGMAQRSNMVNDLVTLYDRRSLVFAKAGRYDEAYRSLKDFRNLSDSLLSVEKQKEITELEKRYETRQKEAENQLLKKDIEVKNTRLWVMGAVSATGILSLVVITGFFIMRNRRISYQRHITEGRNKMLEMENQKNQTELQNKELENRLKEEHIEKLKYQTSLREQELVYHTLARAELTQILRSVKDKLSPFYQQLSRKKDQAEFQQALLEITRDSKKDPLSEFEILFKQLHPSFYDRLLAVNPTLSKTELMISGMLRLNLSSKDISSLLNLSVNTIEATRSHIRKKLNLEAGENLTGYMISL